MAFLCTYFFQEGVEMIREIYFDGRHPAIAYTDYSAVYISTTLQGAQRRTALKHEKGHIWLQHQGRKARLGKGVDNQLWNIAADLEIAKHLYTQADALAISEPRSALAGGVSKEHCEQYPNCTYAEEFYAALLENPGNEMRSHDGGANIEGLPQEVQQALQEILAAAKQASEESDAAEVKAESAARVQQAVKGFQPPKPSLAGLIDRHLGRGKVSPVKGYARPSRRASSADLILKGRKLTVKAPHLTVYVDRSGSFCPAKTAASLSTLKECLTKYRGRVELDVVYFATTLMLADPGKGAGGTNYQPVVDAIYRDRADVSVIITDQDSAEGVTVPKGMPSVLVVPVGCSITSIGAKLGAPHSDPVSA
jgi:predicted metal-dependent peptidase